MNKCYSIVWNIARNMFIVVSERSRGDSRVCTTVAGVLLSAVGVIASNAHATVQGPLSGETIILNNGDTITSLSGETGIDSTVTGGQGVQIEGKASINVTGDSGSTGVKLDNSVINDFGDGTQITVTDIGSTTTGSANGIYISNVNPGTSINANNLLINVASNNSAYGVYIHGKNSSLDFGQGSQINVESQKGNSTGLYFFDGGNTFTMDGGSINVTSITTGKATGIDTSRAEGTTLNLGDNTQIEVNSGAGGGSGLYLGTDTTLNANGLLIDVTAPDAVNGPMLYGIQAGSNSHVNLGEGSQITIATPGGTAYGLTSAMGSEVTADNLTIDVSTTATERAYGRGANISGNIDFGHDSTITVSGFSEGYGLYVSDYTATKKENISATARAENLTIEVTGDKTEGIRIEGGLVDLGSGSSVSANGTASTIYLTGRGYSELDADNLTVKTARGTAIVAQSNMYATAVDIGEGSTIDGRSDTGSTNGLLANTPYTATSTINFNGSQEHRNTIYAVDGYGASAQFSGSTINISNTDIIMNGVNPYGLWAIGDNSFTSAGIINASNMNIDMTGASSNAYGVVAQQGGIINLSGDTTIKTNDDGIAIWVPKVSSGGYILPGGTINGTGKMTITGDIVNSGWGYISLTMDAGSYFEGATSINNDFNAQGLDSVLNLTLSDHAKWVVTDSSTLTSLDNAGTVELAADSTLHADNLTLQESSILNVDLSAAALASANNAPLITGGEIALGGDLHIRNTGNTLDTAALASDDQLQDIEPITLIDTDSAITGDFASLSTDTDSMPDYLSVFGQVSATDNTQYQLSVGLSWYAGQSGSVATPAHGTFTLDADHYFTVNSQLEDVTSDTRSGWDGKSLAKKGEGTLTLTANNTYSGTTAVQEGTLWLTETGVIGATGSQQYVNIEQGSTLGGTGVVNGNVDNAGTLRFGDNTAAQSGFIINGNVTNTGSIASSGTTPGNTLTINGNYTGTGGNLTLNTYLGDDSSPTDELIVSGDVDGKTTLYINQAGGEGAFTDQGIEIVNVGGTSTDDAFSLGNRVLIGPYEYRLYEDNENWYLRSQAETPDGGGDITPVDPDDGGSDVTPVDPDDGGSDVTPVDPDDGGSDVTPVDPDDDGSDVTPVDPDDGGSDITPVDPDDGKPSNPQYRSDIGAYLGNQWLARELQMQTLFDREDSQYRSHEGDLWLRVKGGNTDSTAADGNVDMDSDYVQFQLGGDIATWNNGQQSLTLGLMGSYINGSTDSTGNRGADGSQFSATGDIDGYNLGVYATWYADAMHHRGWYVDSWYQYGFYDNSVENGDAGTTHYDSTANALSLESGYRYTVDFTSNQSLSLIPQLQVVWQSYKADSVQTHNTRIDGQNSENWTTRLGLRVEGSSPTTNAVLQPFAEVNWLHMTDDMAVSFDNSAVNLDLPADRAEIKLGLQAAINSQWSISAQATGQKGNNDFSDLSGSVNLHYSW
ncbi:autotransporter outer membrane beta-barrel domain-containing protein [Citrobacter freundii]|uniref:autotransporter outer membrane beta-barrel domain-containing protein n=1 Tax=Citrobacter freundii TaxID=546 RepID=UPI0017872055|nr:autotransporter outer membrane beta-barrel domain-containing protein [Citrobacter freundii]MBD9991383.1 autotransporter outer membrane beta-barrel domain-containing protein [Citrobacter freundii]MBE0055294.1 autotransporter outer membrane beta-barrel domain-containing protein [Citrobacter freundii]MDT7291334.1 autotransporter outer membrane beta-barrel domain-containing protein [Citrobacter freundii]HBU6168656.1 autotransporter outer membrane beta-barrel domain-containing protein [Citrobacte